MSIKIEFPGFFTYCRSTPFKENVVFFVVYSTFHRSTRDWLIPRRFQWMKLFACWNLHLKKATAINVYFFSVQIVWLSIFIKRLYGGWEWYEHTLTEFSVQSYDFVSVFLIHYKRISSSYKIACKYCLSSLYSTSIFQIIFFLVTFRHWNW